MSLKLSEMLQEEPVFFAYFPSLFDDISRTELVSILCIFQQQKSRNYKLLLITQDSIYAIIEFISQFKELNMNVIYFGSDRNSEFYKEILQAALRKTPEDRNVSCFSPFYSVEDLKRISGKINERGNLLEISISSFDEERKWDCLIN